MPGRNLLEEISEFWIEFVCNYEKWTFYGYGAVSKKIITCCKMAVSFNFIIWQIKHVHIFRPEEKTVG